MKERSEEFAYTLVIRESLLDAYGHVNNASYMQILEEARWEFISQRGYGLKEVQQRQIGPVVLDATMKFKREIRLREKVTIKSYAHNYLGKVCKVVQTIYKETGEEACAAEFTCALFDLKARKILPPTPEWLKAIGLE